MITSTIVAVAASGLVLLHERLHYAQAGNTRVDIRFLGFTNREAPDSRLATFAISNASPWPIFNFEYPTEEVLQPSGKTLSLPHSFESGSWVLQPNEVMIDRVQISTIDRKSWRLVAEFGRYEDPIIHVLHQFRFHFDKYLNSPPWDFYSTNTEWRSE
jgi:hypothetical protein